LCFINNYWNYLLQKSFTVCPNSTIHFPLNNTKFTQSTKCSQRQPLEVAICIINMMVITAGQKSVTNLLFLVFGSTEVWTQGFRLAGQALYCLSHTSSPRSTLTFTFYPTVKLHFTCEGRESSECTLPSKHGRRQNRICLVILGILIAYIASENEEIGLSIVKEITAMQNSWELVLRSCCI
jgi:hypothetical protein